MGEQAARGREIVVSGAFRPQRTTGQQRYATEIADRLVAAGVREMAPSDFWARSALRTWLWTLLILPIRARRAVLVSLTSRAPVWHPRHVLAVHDLFVLTNPEWYSKKYIWTHVPLLRLQLRWCSSVVAVSQPVADQVASHAEAGPVTLAPNAPSEIFIRAEPADGALQRLELTPNRFVLAIGSQDPRKNLARLARAWTDVPEATRLACPLVIVGGGDSIFRQAEIVWPTGTIVTGYVSDPELVGLYGAARAVALVSLAEGFGLPIVEAAAAGVERFLLSDIEVFHWIAGDAAVYVDPLSDEAMTVALHTVVTEEPTNPGRVEVSRFAWAQSAEAVLASAQVAAVQ